MIVPIDIWQKLLHTHLAVLRHEARMFAALAEFARAHPDLDMSEIAAASTDMNVANEQFKTIAGIVTEENKVTPLLS